MESRDHPGRRDTNSHKSKRRRGGSYGQSSKNIARSNDTRIVFNPSAIRQKNNGDRLDPIDFLHLILNFRHAGSTTHSLDLNRRRQNDLSQSKIRLDPTCTSITSIPRAAVSSTSARKPRLLTNSAMLFGKRCAGSYLTSAR